MWVSQEPQDHKVQLVMGLVSQVPKVQLVPKVIMDYVVPLEPQVRLVPQEPQGIILV